MGRCLGTAPSRVSAVVRDNTPQGVTPGSPGSLKGVTQWILAQMEQVRSLSASTQRVDANGVVAR